MSKFAKCVLALAAAVSLSANAALVDDFSDVQAQITTGGAAVGASTIGGMIGGQRDVIVEKFGAAGGSVSAEVSGGSFIYGQAGSSVGQGILRWDGAGTTWNQAINTAGLGSKDLTANTVNGFAFNVFSDGGTIDQGGPLGWIKVEAWGAGGTEYAQTFFPAISFTGPVTLLFNDPAWIKSGGFTFADVSALQVTINVDMTAMIPGSSRAVSLDVELTTIDGSIPEPASLALVGAALLGVGALRRRKA